MDEWYDYVSQNIGDLLCDIDYELTLDDIIKIIEQMKKDYPNLNKRGGDLDAD